ncbi:hypothetical protein IWQ57_004799 [Coemansia nantahalensis]|uniref:Uncharacterized protein n=2 Tax=Coemansia TaxID=4863 RepID=A0ACC1KJ90_9FUNG|nr:hypothetical protein IWQ57_004799 [Coemansia nantahalensis]KAJ2790916.1 hypothetical protein H4R21_006415 [Coemansia helicoidea]
MSSGKAAADAPKGEQQHAQPAALAGRLDAQAAELQRMLGSLATQVAAAEHAAEESVSASAADQQQQQQEQQRSVGDALKDMANTEKAMDSFESRLDSLLSKLDSLIDDDGGSNSG